MRLTKKSASTVAAGGCVVLLSVVGAAYAASMTVTSSELGAGRGSVGTCQTGAITTSWTPNTDVLNDGTGWKVVNVRLTGVSNACTGRTVFVTLVKEAGTAPVVSTVLGSGSIVVPAPGATVVAPFAVPMTAASGQSMLAADVSKVDVLIPS